MLDLRRLAELCDIFLKSATAVCKECGTPNEYLDPNPNHVCRLCKERANMFADKGLVDKKKEAPSLPKLPSKPAPSKFASVPIKTNFMVKLDEGPDAKFVSTISYQYHKWDISDTDQNQYKIVVYGDKHLIEYVSNKGQETYRIDGQDVSWPVFESSLNDVFDDADLDVSDPFTHIFQKGMHEFLKIVNSTIKSHIDPNFDSDYQDADFRVDNGKLEVTRIR